MSNHPSSTDKTATLCAIAIFAAMALGCSLPTLVSRSVAPPVASPSPSPTPKVTPKPSATPTPFATPDKQVETRAKEFAFNVREDELRKLPARVQLTKEPYIRGKAAFYSYDVELGEEPLWLLDNDLRGDFSGYDQKIKDVTAQMPEEVETVVLRRCQQVRKGTYRIYSKATDATLNTVPAYIWRCELTIVDRTIPAVIHRKRFESTLEETGSATGHEEEFDAGIPYEEIYEFLAALPRR